MPRLIESLALSSAGAAVGCAVALAGVEAYRRLATAPHAYAQWEVAVDWKVSAYLAGSSVVAALLFGLAPARRLFRIEGMTSLKDGGRIGSAGPSSRRLAAAMVVIEMALAVAVLAMASVMIRSLINIGSSDIGVRSENVLTA